MDGYRHYFILMVFILTTSGVQANIVDIPPTITRQSHKDIYYKVGETVKVVCEGTGNPFPTFTWEKSGIYFEPAGNSKRVVQLDSKGTLVINAPEDKDESIYQCFAENHLGRAASIKYNVRMAKLNDFRSKDPIYHDVQIGSYHNLSCSKPDGVPDPEIYWAIRQEDGSFEPLIWNSTMSVDYDDNLHIAHVTADNYQNGNSYHCIASNKLTRSSVAGPPNYIRPRGTTGKTNMKSRWPQNKFNEIGLVGTTHKLKCIYSGNPTPRVAWTRDDGRKFSPRHDASSSKGQELIISDLQLEDEGRYTCSATTDDGMTELQMTVNLNVEYPPQWMVKPVDVKVGQGDTATFECAGHGKPSPEVSWYINGKKLSDALVINTHLDQRFKKLKANSIVLENVVDNDAMVVQCNVTNPHGYLWGQAYLNVMTEAPVILKGPEMELKVAEGQDFELTCHVSGKPDPIITWFKDGRQITGGRYTVVKPGNLHVNTAVLADSGAYRCHATNNTVSVEASGFVVVRRKTIIEQRPRDLEIRRGVYAKFTCSGTTDPEEIESLKTYWMKDQKPVVLGSRMFQNIQDHSLTISGTEERDTGTFTCVVTNGLDQDSASARLVVTDVPNRPVRVAVNNTCMTDGVAELTWTPGSFNNAPIQYFAVEYKTKTDPDNWVYYDEFIDQTKAKAFIKLASGQEYAFRVTAINKIGSSLPSDSTTQACTTEVTVPTNNPKNVRTIGNVPGHIHIEWTPVPPKEQGGKGFGYRIHLQEIGKSPNGEQNMNKKEITNWREYQYDWPSDGKVYQAYNVTIQSFNVDGDCNEDARPVRGYSAEGLPMLSPTELTAEETGSDYVLFQWLFPSKQITAINTRIRGEFRGFKIQAWHEGRKSSTIRDWDVQAEEYRNHSGDVYQARVAPVAPNTRLMATVAVLNNFFVGQPSEAVRLTTLPGLPGPVAYMEAINVGDNHITLIWDAPLDQRGDLLGYDIGYQIESGLHLDEIQERVPQIDDPFATTAILAGLVPLTKYRIHIWARTSAGRGESYFIERSTGSPGMLEVPRYKIKDVGSDYINVSWYLDPYKKSNSIVFVQYKKQDGAEWFSTSPDISRTWVTIKPLQAGIAYSIRVVATNGNERRLSVEEDVTTDGPALAYDVIANLGWFLGMIFAILLEIGLIVAMCIMYKRGYRLNTRNDAPKTYTTSGGQTHTGTTHHRDDFPRTSSDFGPEPPGFHNDYYDDKDSYEEHDKKRDYHTDTRHPGDERERGYDRSNGDSMKKEDYDYQDFEDVLDNRDDYDYDAYPQPDSSPHHSYDYNDNDRRDPDWDDGAGSRYVAGKRARPNDYDDRYDDRYVQEPSRRNDYGDRYHDDPARGDRYDNGRYEDVQYHPDDYPEDQRRPRQHQHHHHHDDHDHDHDRCQDVMNEVSRRISGEPISSGACAQYSSSSAV